MKYKEGNFRMPKTLSAILAILLAGCAAAAGDPPSWNGGPDMNANYLQLPDGSQLRAWQSTRAADADGLFQYGMVGTARTYPGGRTDVSGQGMYNPSEGGFWAGAGVGLLQSGASELGGLIFLGQHQPGPSNLTVNASASAPANISATSTSAGGAGGSATGGTAFGGSGGSATAMGGSASATGGSAASTSRSTSRANPTISPTISSTVSPTITSVNKQQQQQKQKQNLPPCPTYICH